nr:zinc finger protein 77-like [Neomonachus schauinslandi]
MFSMHNNMKLQVNNKKRKKLKHVEAKQHATKHQWVNKEVKEESVKYLEPNKNKCMMQHFWRLQHKQCQDKRSASRTQRNILQNELPSEEKIVIFARNDSCSVFGENRKFHDSGDQTQTQEGHLRSHLVEHICESNEGNQCGDTINQITSFTVHEDCTTGDKSCECVKCREAFTDGSFPENPGRSHPGHKPSPCEECGPACSYVLSCSTDLDADLVEKPYERREHQDSGTAFKRHLNNLSSKKSLECKKCGKAFTHTSSFQDHVQGHCGQNVHVCDVCGKAFMYNSDLTRHVRTHTGESPYKCVECGKAFRSTSSLQRHVRTHDKRSASRTQRNILQNELPSEEKIVVFARNDSCSVFGENRKFHDSGDQTQTQEGHLRHHLVERVCESNEGNQCGETMRQITSFAVHEDCPPGEKSHECTKCREAFADGSFPENPGRSHPGHKPSPCEECGPACSCVLSFSPHVGADLVRKPYECQDTGRGLKRELKSLSSKKSLECKKCGKAFTHTSSFQGHVRGHCGQRVHACDVCGKAFMYHSCLTRHVRTHTGMKPSDCTDYGKAYICLSYSQDYSSNQTGKRIFRCGQCGKAFTRQAYLLVHVRTHTGERPYECQQCEKTFTDRGNLREHVRTHTGERPYECQECGKTFKYNSGLRAHMRAHTGERPYKCQHCGKAFTGHYSLLVHVRTHTGDRPYECVECGKTFQKCEHFKRHMTTHSTVKPYECKECGRAFRDRTDLRIHMRTHTGERPYECQQCGKTFRHLGNLRGHVRTHTGERPYECQQCGKTFRYNSDLREHVRTHTGERPYKCQQCGKAFIRRYTLLVHILEFPDSISPLFSLYY